MLRALVNWSPVLLVLCWAGCAAFGGELDTCDPGYVTAKLQAMGLECRAKRLRECPYVSQEQFEQAPLMCPAVVACYARIDQEVQACSGR